MQLKYKFLTKKDRDKIMEMAGGAVCHNPDSLNPYTSDDLLNFIFQK
jgi:Ni2+-binding GTPase involved in maturation of urease and hydrogenase